MTVASASGIEGLAMVVADEPPSADASVEASVQPCVEGPSYPLPQRLLTVALTVAVLVGLVRGVVLGTWPVLPPALWWLLAAMHGVMLVGGAAVVAGRTRIDARTIRCGWPWQRVVQRGDIVQARLVSVPGLGWLVVPRLMLRTRTEGVVKVPAGNEALLEAFRAFTGAPRRA